MWIELVETLMHTIITIATPILVAFVARWLNVQAEQVKKRTNNETAARYITEITNAVSTAVLHTAQTYVDTLKKDGVFDADNQRAALNTALSQAKSMLTADASGFIQMAYGDINKYLETRIEAEVKLCKSYN
jgi:hypothetical protein